LNLVVTIHPCPSLAIRKQHRILARTPHQKARENTEDHHSEAGPRSINRDRSGPFGFAPRLGDNLLKGTIPTYFLYRNGPEAQSHVSDRRATK